MGTEDFQEHGIIATYPAMVETYYHTFVQTHRMYKKKEP